jgi:hypothetical protein
MIRSFTFPDSRTAYDASQTNDDIRDGDVLLVPSEGNVAILVQFDGGTYLSSAIVAIALGIAEGLKAAGMGVFTGEVPRMHEIARQHGWTDTP